MTRKHEQDDWDAPAQAQKPPAKEGFVRVKCIVDTRPFTHEKGLDRDEEADVPEEVASAMIAAKQVERV